MVTELLCAFLVGGGLYVLVELLYRGHSHSSMAVVGGVCFTLLYLIATRSGWPAVLICAAGAVVITAVEFVAGWVINIRLGWAVWDYSGQRFHLYGQICPAFLLVWFALCWPALWLAEVLRGFFT